MKLKFFLMVFCLILSASFVSALNFDNYYNFTLGVNATVGGSDGINTGATQQTSGMVAGGHFSYDGDDKINYNFVPTEGDNNRTIGFVFKDATYNAADTFWSYGTYNSVGEFLKVGQGNTNKNDVYVAIYGAYVNWNCTNIDMHDGDLHTVVLQVNDSETNDLSNLYIWCDGVRTTTTTATVNPTTNLNTGNFHNLHTGVNIGDSIQYLTTEADGGVDELFFSDTLWLPANITEWDTAVRVNNETYPFVETPTPTPDINHSVESVVKITQIGSFGLNSASFQEVVTGNFTISDDLNASLGFTVNGIPNANRDMTCRALVNGIDHNTSQTRSFSSASYGSMYLTSTVFQLPNATNNISLECALSSPTNMQISNSVGLISLLEDNTTFESLNFESVIFSAALNSNSYTNIGNITFEMSNRTVNSTINKFLILDGSLNYNYTSTGTIDLYTVINGTQTGSYPRYGTAGSTGVVGALFEQQITPIINDSQNVTIEIWGKSSTSDGVVSGGFLLKEFLSHENEINTTKLNGTTYSSSSLTKIINLTVENVDHSSGLLVVKAGIPHISTAGAGRQTFMLGVDNDNGSLVIRDVASANQDGVSIVQDTFSVGVGSHTVYLYGASNVVVNITGGDLTAYYADLTPFVPNSYEVRAFNYWDNSSITNFNVTNSDGSVFTSNSSGIAVIPGNGLDNITFSASNYFSTTELNHNTTNNFNFSVVQSDVKFQAFEIITDNGLTSVNFNINGTIKGVNESFFLKAGSYNLTAAKTGYYNVTVEVNVTALDNKTINITDLFNHKLSFFANNALSGTALNNFTILLNTSNVNFQNLTADGNNITFNLTTNANYTSVIDASGFAYSFAEHDNLTGLNSSYTYNLLTAQSINITFRESTNGTLLVGTNITIQFIGSQNFTNTTNSSYLYVDLLMPSEYTIIYSAPGYRQGQYILEVNNKSTQNLTLYLQLSNTSSLILLTVSDTFGNPVQGADITIQRYINNSWQTEQILRTDFQGRQESYFILSTTFYNFLIDFEGTTFFGEPNSNPNKKVIYAEDVISGLNFFINILGTESVVSTVTGIFDIEYNLSFVDTSGNLSSGYFRYFYDDPANSQRIACLEVTGDNKVWCSCADTTVSSQSSTIACFINQTSGRATYTAKGYIDGQLAVSLIKTLGVDTRINWGLNGWFIAFIIILLSYFIFITVPGIGVYFGTGMLVVLSVLGLIFQEVEFGVMIVLLVMSYLVATIKSDSGVNG